MAVDTTLISGAYKANAPLGVPGVEAITKGAKATSGLLNQFMVQEKAKSNKLNGEYEAYAQEVLNQSDLKGAEYSTLYDDLMSGKDDYLGGDKKSRAVKVRELGVMSEDYEAYKGIREDMALNMDKMSKRYSNSEEGSVLIKAMSGEGKNLETRDGRLGLEVGGEWKNMNELNILIEEGKIDEGSREALRAFEMLVIDSDTYKTGTTKNKIRNDLVGKGKLKSLAYDEMIPGRDFYTDLIEDLSSAETTYGDLGIQDSDFADYEGVDISDGIQPEEAKIIADALVEDEALLEETLTNYYTSYINKQHTNAFPPEVDEGDIVPDDEVFSSNEVDEMYEDYQASNAEANGQAVAVNADVEGGEVDTEGVWTPEGGDSESTEVKEEDNGAPSWGGKPLTSKASKALTPLSVDVVGGKAHILENGNKITVKNIDGPVGSTIDVGGVRADGNDIVIDAKINTILGSKNTVQDFGTFKRVGGNHNYHYKWVPDEASMEMFNKNATKAQREAFEEFITQVQKDPMYADSLLDHVNNGKGSLNAATLK